MPQEKNRTKQIIIGAILSILVFGIIYGTYVYASLNASIECFFNKDLRKLSDAIENDDDAKLFASKYLDCLDSEMGIYKYFYDKKAAIEETTFTPK